MIVCETRTFTLGPYTVRQSPRFDNPAWPVYTILKNDKIIGKSFSIPDLGCCRWLEINNGVYARRDETYQPEPLRLRGAILAKARKRKEEPEPDITEAFAST